MAPQSPYPVKVVNPADIASSSGATGAGTAAAAARTVTATDSPDVAVLGTAADAAVITDAVGTISAKLRGIVAILAAQSGYMDGLEALATTLNGYVDGLEALVTTGNATSVSIAGYVDGLEALATSLNGYVDGLEGLVTSTNTKLDTIDGHVDGLEGVSGTTADAAVITDANGTISAKLRGVVTLLATQAAYLDGIEGKLDAIKGYTVNSTATITRPADTTAYAAKDAISSSTSAPAILTFANCARASAGSGYITSARVVTNQAACVSAFRLHLYDATLSAVNDNAAQTVLETNWGSSIGYIDFPAMATDGSDTASSQSVDKPLPFVAAGTSLFGMLETITGFTPASAQHFQVKLGIEQN